MKAKLKVPRSSSIKKDKVAGIDLKKTKKIRVHLTLANTSN